VSILFSPAVEYFLSHFKYVLPLPPEKAIIIIPAKAGMMMARTVYNLSDESPNIVSLDSVLQWGGCDY